ncbi:hypothetical protein ACQKLP_23595 [Chitinophaga sp. NPDC101104]|uniref:hypothetical protein n=1 Tax=Chitinophaga sp. NPDC101104 TaxID=3390561 RepID=UPI003CFFA939
MNQDHTIFDEEFEAFNTPRRRDLMPKWLVVYMWIIIFFGLFMICYAGWMVTFVGTGDALVSNSPDEAAYRVGNWIGAILPGILFVLMGELVRSERKLAIRFNWIVAILWVAVIMLMVFSKGIRGLLVGMFVPIFLPYWIGLFMIQRNWKKARGNE